MSLKFYKCNTCGNLIVKIIDGETIPVCCGKQMTELRPAMTDGALEKHVPVWKRDKNTVDVTVGQIEHPMTLLHHIDFIVLETTKGFYVQNVFNSDCENCKPEACFTICKDEEPVAVYEYCNLHGIYVSMV